MNLQLVVVRPFGAFKAGAVVSDPKTMLEIQQGEHADHVVRAAASQTVTTAAFVQGDPGVAGIAANVKEG